MFQTFEPFLIDGKPIEGPHPISEMIDRLLYTKTPRSSANEPKPDLWYPNGPQRNGGVAVTLYHPGKCRLRTVRRGSDVNDTLAKALVAARRHKRFSEFPSDCRITMDFFDLEDQAIRFADLKPGSLDADRFEFGVHGLYAKARDKHHYFLPGDSYVRSIYSLKDLSQHLAKALEIQDMSNCKVRRIRSTSIVNYDGRWLNLFRGHPVYQTVTCSHVETVCARAVDHILKYMGGDGRFLYYYDAAKDNEINHEHPRRDPRVNPYYNELRHSGGIITLLLAAGRYGRERFRAPIVAAIDFLVQHSVVYSTPEGVSARYILYNRKSKLGGSGLALYAMALYKKVYECDRYRRIANEFASHLCAEILPSGELRYYHVYLDKHISPEENHDYFSFYYPGEALIGLATYLKWVNRQSEGHGEIVDAMRMALRFLLVERPKIHKSHYASLPSDAWLMQAINEMADIPGLDDPSYAAFVYGDADTMLSQMYTKANALFPDYPGAFYYRYGDLPYPDGARCEGLVAALELAMKRGDSEKVSRYASGLVKTIRATILLANTPESVYFAPNPAKAIGCVRFKLTRQWSRIDTIQHVVCYYFRFLAAYETLLANSVALDDRLSQRHGDCGEPVRTKAQIDT